MAEIINTDFIGCASLNELGLLVYHRLPIPKLYDEEMQTLQAMCENENRTVMDLQDYFQQFMSKNHSPYGYDYCAPYAYYSSFIDWALYPPILKFDAYKAVFTEVEERETLSFIFEKNVEHISELTSSQCTELQKKISKEKEACKERLKSHFCKRAFRYIQAYRYYSEIQKVKSNPNNKMYSTENIGWTTFEYPISNDILFFMKSNFGYGSSSYHYINISYKGIDILPYSAIVQYYYVNMVEFYRFTRQYRPSHENWEVALDFVVDAANLALQDEAAFIEKWIGNEIDEMVKGLKIISEQPQKCLREFLNNPKRNINLLYVRNAYDSDKREYEAYPEEISTVFKAEKLSAALELLDKLKNLAPAYPKALEAIEKIRMLNVDFFPNLKEYIDIINAEILRRQEILKPKVEKRDTLKAKAKPHYDKIIELIEEAKKEGNYSSSQIREKYLTDHPDFKVLYEDIEQRSEEIDKDQHKITMRENFVARLVDCKALIIERLELAA